MSAGSRFNNDLRYRDAQHPQQTQLTPSYVLDPVRQALGSIELDPCTLPDNPVGAERFYTVDDDGLTQPWDARTIFVNPPYGKAREPWVERCIEAAVLGAKVVLLIPAHTDTRIFQRAVTTGADVVFIRGRVKFGTLRPNRRQEAASHPSALIGWNVDLEPCAVLGLALRALSVAPPTTTPTEPESFHAIRRCDGEPMGDYLWMRVDGPDVWSPTCDDDYQDEPVEYEIVRMVVEPIAKRTFGNPRCALCDEPYPFDEMTEGADGDRVCSGCIAARASVASSAPTPPTEVHDG